MHLEPTTPQEIAAACADLLALGPFAPTIATGLAAADPDQMRAAVTHLIEADRRDGLRELVERFRPKRDFGVWARVTSAHLHRAVGEFAAGLADIEDLMALFPQRAAAHWWVGKARCLEGLNRLEEAAATAREAIARWPDSPLPRVFLANLMSRQRRLDEALGVWRDLHAHFPAPELGWFVGLANALKSLEREDEAQAVLQEAVSRFGDTRAGCELVIEIAEQRADWNEALARWDEFARLYAADGDVKVALGRARALFRLDRVDEADAALDRLLALEPDQPQALREQAHFAIELGESARARDLLIRLTQRWAGKSRPEWWAWLARVNNDLRDYAAADAALAQLERRFPESALAEGERLRLFKELEYGHDDLRDRIAAALKRFPEDTNLRAHWVWILVSLGRLAEAEREVQALEVERADGHALGARLRLEADRGDENLRAYVEHLAEGREWSLHDTITIAHALLDTRTSWAFERGQKIVEAAAERFAGNVRLNHLRIRLAIARRDDAAALALIEALPPRYVRREYLEHKAWAAAKRGRDADAKRLWAQVIAANYHAAIEAPIHSLSRISPDDRPGPEVGVTAYVVFRNEAAQIPGFLAHHRRLGVKRFVFFDHQSDDASRALALAEPDVIVYDCPDSYQLSWSGRRWVNEIVAREGARGWGLQLDMDEYLLYPGCESLPIERFVAYLDARGYEGVRGFMLDVFPRRLLLESGEPTPFSDYRFYDDDYFVIGMERPPYLHLNGGVRARLFEAKEFLQKTPMWRLDAGRLINSHDTTHLKFADVSAALLHYKLMNVALRARNAAVEHAGAAFLEADADVEAIRRHSRYAARLQRLWRADLVAPGVTRELEPSLALAERGLMDISNDYRQWLDQG